MIIPTDRQWLEALARLTPAARKWRVSIQIIFGETQDAKPYVVWIGNQHAKSATLAGAIESLEERADSLMRQ